MRREQVVTGLAGQYAAFAALIDELGPDMWSAPTRCTAWEVRDVAGHVIGNVVDTVKGAIGTRTPDEQAREFRDRTPGDLAAELREAATTMLSFIEALDDDIWNGPSPVAGRSVGNGVLTFCYDTFVHDDDIRAALGRPGGQGPGLAASVRWVRDELERLGWGPARLALDGMTEYAIGTGGPVVLGDPLRFVLVATGRLDPAEFGLDASVNVHRLR